MVWPFPIRKWLTMAKLCQLCYSLHFEQLHKGIVKLKMLNPVYCFTNRPCNFWLSIST